MWRGFRGARRRSWSTRTFSMNRGSPDRGLLPGVTMLRASAMGPGGRLAMAGRSEAPSDVVIDHANVLHERVHARGAHEAVSLSFQLPGKRLRLWCRRGDLGNGSRHTFARSLIGLREYWQARRRGHHRSRVVDGGLDLGTVADD